MTYLDHLVCFEVIHNFKLKPSASVTHASIMANCIAEWGVA